MTNQEWKQHQLAIIIRVSESQTFGSIGLFFSLIYTHTQKIVSSETPQFCVHSESERVEQSENFTCIGCENPKGKSFHFTALSKANILTIRGLGFYLHSGQAHRIAPVFLLMVLYLQFDDQNWKFLGLRLNLFICFYK